MAVGSIPKHETELLEIFLETLERPFLYSPT